MKSVCITKPVDEEFFETMFFRIYNKIVEKENSEIQKKMKKVSDFPPLLVFSFALATANLITFPLNSEWVSLLTSTLFGTDHRTMLGERRLKLIQEAIIFFIMLGLSLHFYLKEEKEDLINENIDQYDINQRHINQCDSKQYDSDQQKNNEQNNEQTLENDLPPNTIIQCSSYEQCNKSGNSKIM